MANAHPTSIRSQCVPPFDRVRRAPAGADHESIVIVIARDGDGAPRSESGA